MERTSSQITIGMVGRLGLMLVHNGSKLAAQ